MTSKDWILPKTIGQFYILGKFYVFVFRRTTQRLLEDKLWPFRRKG